jgi:flagellar basal body-associated protein FliL
MKTKALILLAVVAVATLSFTFASKKNQSKAAVATEQANEPIGGFVSEDKF